MKRIIKDDLVKIVSGNNKGKIGKVTKVCGNEIWVENINLRERHIRPNRINPRGGKKDVHLPIDISNVAVIHDGKEEISRIGYKVAEDGSKSRVAKKTRKELK